MLLLQVFAINHETGPITNCFATYLPEKFMFAVIHMPRAANQTRKGGKGVFLFSHLLILLAENVLFLK